MEQFATSSMSVPSMITLRKQNLKRGRVIDSDDAMDGSPDMNKIG